jgi:hypothetical protein
MESRLGRCRSTVILESKYRIPFIFRLRCKFKKLFYDHGAI